MKRKICLFSAFCCALLFGINHATIAQGCYTATVTNQPVTVSITTQPVAQNKCLGSSVTFSVTASGTSPYTYQWIKDGFIIPGATSTSYTIPSVSLASQGMYYCQVSNLCRNVTSNQVELKVVNLTINAGLDSTFCNNTTVQLNAVASTNYPSLSQPYTSINWSPSTGLSATNIINPVAQPLSTTTYSVTLTDALGCTATDAIILTSKTPVSIATQPLSYNKCLNSNVTFTLNASGTAPISYIWKKNGTPITGATSNTYTINGLALSDEGIFTCEPTNYCNTLISNNAQLKVIALTANAGLDARICNGQSTQLQATGSTNHVTESGTLNYNWSPATGLNFTNISNPLANPIINTTYTVMVTDLLNCSENAQVNVVVGNVFQNEQICLVTVDSTFTKNLIIWEKPVATDINSFIIYRKISSVYNPITSIPYSATSIYTDISTGVNPNTASYEYKISVMDTCGNVSALSNEHRTIHVAISPATPCGYNLIWNDYIGFPVTQYLIYRDSSNTGWQKIDSISYGNTSWTDFACYLPNDTISYLVEAVNPAGCNPSKANAHSSTRSNVQRNYATSIPMLSTNDFNLKIYPNPTNDYFTLDIRSNNLISNVNVEVYNYLGQRVISKSFNPNKNGIVEPISLSELVTGIYFVKVFVNDKQWTGNVIKK